MNHTATTEIYTLSLHDALPISLTANGPVVVLGPPAMRYLPLGSLRGGRDRKSTRPKSTQPDISRMPSFVYESYGDHRDLHSFPTRRSSDLLDRERPRRGVAPPGHALPPLRFPKGR